jgi:hypothetical protein
MWCFQSNGSSHEFYNLTMLFFFNLSFIFPYIRLFDLITWPMSSAGWPRWARAFFLLIIAKFFLSFCMIDFFFFSNFIIQHLIVRNWALRFFKFSASSQMIWVTSLISYRECILFFFLAYFFLKIKLFYWARVWDFMSYDFERLSRV